MARLCILCGLGGMLFLAGYVGFLHRRAVRELAVWKARMESKGELFSVRSLRPNAQTSPDANSTLAGFSNLVSQLPTQWIAAGDLTIMGTTGPDHAIPAWKAPFWRTRAGRRVDWKEAQRNIVAIEPSLQRLHTLLQDVPLESGYDYSGGEAVGASWLPTIHRFGRAVAGAAVFELHRTNYAAAFERCQDLVRLSRLCEDDLLLGNQVMRSAVVVLAHGVTWNLLQAPDLDDSHLQQLQKAWSQVETLRKMGPTLAMERAQAVGYFESARTRGGRTSERIGLPLRNPMAARFNQVLYAPFWRLFWAANDELHYLQAMQEDLDLTRWAARGHPLAGLQMGLVESDRRFHSGVSKYRFPLSHRLFINMPNAFEAPIRAEAVRDMTLAALGSKRYQMKYGRLPASLEQLVPKFLASVPKDRMTGGTLFHCNQPEQTALFRSAGANGVNENGLGDDICWPLPGRPSRLIAKKHEEPDLINIDGRPLRETTLLLARKAGLKVSIDPEVARVFEPASDQPPTVSVRLEAVTAFDTLNALLESHGLALTAPVGCNTVYITLKPAVSVDEMQVEAETDEATDQTLVPLIVIDEVPLLDALRNVARHAGVNIVFDAKLVQATTQSSRPTVCVRYTDITAGEAMRRILSDHNLRLKPCAGSKIFVVIKKSME